MSGTGLEMRIKDLENEIHHLKLLNDSDHLHISLLKESEEKFRNLIELAVDGILIGSHEGIVLEANSCFCEMIGMDKQEVIGSHISIMPFTKESLEKAPFRFDLLQKGEVVISERELIRNNGTKITIEMRTKMMPDGTYQSIYRDITNRKNNEIQLQKYADELSVLNSDKNRFMSILAHDLRGPFSSILGFLKLLKSNVRQYSIQEIEEHINTVNYSAQSIYKLLEDILMWARSQSGVLPFVPQKLSFTQIFNEVNDILKISAESKSIAIKLFVNEADEIFADSEMIKTILRNLISNSIKFTGKGGEVNVYVEKAGSDILCTIEDNGNGISPDLISKLFGNVNNPSLNGTSEEKGSGLGLTLCKLFVKKHGGEIWVKSEIGKGSRFFFTIPLGN